MLRMDCISDVGGEHAWRECECGGEVIRRRRSKRKRR